MFKKTNTIKRYFVKKDGIVNEVTKEEYEKFKLKLEELNKFYLCPNCKECTCEKIFYRNIYRSNEVVTAAYTASYNTYKNDENNQERKKKEVLEFVVYDCDRLQLYSHLVLDENGMIQENVKLLEEKNEAKKMEKLRYRANLLDSLRNNMRK